ncbi:hypothetical protein ACIF80_31005 [Streptomyces sp. NPDC085927]|uniref:hypothetical protein n=1 Tax=Streptomyces sp. NPDC085927 TaxID=3365738 RepID=UPI0037D7D169
MQPQQPYQAPAPPSPPGSPAASGRSRGPLVIALLVGLVVGGAAVGAAWALTGDTSGTSGTGGSARDDARGACDALAGVDESKFSAKGRAGELAMYRFAGAFDLAAAAAAGDSSYEPLAKAVSRASNRHRQVFEVDAEVRKELAKARGICADL